MINSIEKDGKPMSSILTFGPTEEEE